MMGALRGMRAAARGMARLAWACPELAAVLAGPAESLR